MYEIHRKRQRSPNCQIETLRHLISGLASAAICHECRCSQRRDIGEEVTTVEFSIVCRDLDFPRPLALIDGTPWQGTGTHLERPRETIRAT